MDAALTKINERLKIAQIGVSVEQIGDRLYLRATLPPKPSSSKIKPYQQRIALGIYASKEGFKRAEAEAHLLGGLIACKNFQWESYLKIPAGESPEIETIENLIKRFEKFYFDTRDRNHQSETTWIIDYWRVFQKLPQGEILNPQNIPVLSEWENPIAQTVTGL